MSLLHLYAFFIIWDFISLTPIGSLHLWLLFFDGVFGFIIGWISLILQPEWIPWFLMSLALLFVWFVVRDTRDWPIILRIWSQMWGGYCSIFSILNMISPVSAFIVTLWLIKDGWLKIPSFLPQSIIKRSSSILEVIPWCWTYTVAGKASRTRFVLVGLSAYQSWCWGNQWIWLAVAGTSVSLCLFVYVDCVYEWIVE